MREQAVNDPNASTIKNEATGETWSVVVLYEDKPTRDRAMATCDHLVRQFWTEVEFDFHWWRMDFLADPGMAQTAALDAREADIIIFSSAEAEFSPVILRWFDQWPEQRGGREGILLDLTHAPPTSMQIIARKQIFLRQVANHAGLDYLTRLPLQIESTLPNSWQNAEARAGQVTTVLDEILNKLPPPPHFGLNE